MTVTVDQSAIPHSNVFVLEDAGRAFTANCNSVQDLLKYGERDWVKIESEEKARTTTAALLSTSGTTGFPKAAMYSHYSCTMMNHLLNDSKQKPYEVGRSIKSIIALIPLLNVTIGVKANQCPYVSHVCLSHRTYCPIARRNTDPHHATLRAGALSSDHRSVQNNGDADGPCNHQVDPQALVYWVILTTITVFSVDCRHHVGQNDPGSNASLIDAFGAGGPSVGHDRSWVHHNVSVARERS